MIINNKYHNMSKFDDGYVKRIYKKYNLNDIKKHKNHITYGSYGLCYDYKKDITCFIKQKFDEKKEISMELLEFYVYMTYCCRDNPDYEMITTVMNDNDYLVTTNLLSLIIKNADKTFIMIIFDDCYAHKLINKIDYLTIRQVAPNFCEYLSDNLVISYIINNTIFPENDLEFYVDNNNYKIAEKILDKYKIKSIDDNIFIKIITDSVKIYDNLYLVNFIEKHEIYFNINTDTFFAICSSCNFSLIQKCLENKCTPEQKHFQKYLSSSKGTNQSSKTKIINLFVNYGYILSRNDFLETIKHGIKIDVDHLNIDFDDKIIEQIAKYNIRHYDDKILDKTNVIRVQTWK